MHTPLKRIRSVNFGILSPEEIRKMSVTKIITPDTYDDDGYPIEMGLMDRRLGVIDPGLECKTCGGRPGECPGHFGRIELAAPVIHSGYARDLRRLLRVTCRECGTLLLTDKEKQTIVKELKQMKEMNEPVKKIVRKAIREARKTKECQKCGREQNKIKFEKPTTFYEDGEKLTPSDIREWLEKIPDEDVKVLDIDPESARPEWMVLEVLPVPPVTIRPSITLESGQRSEDDITHKLVDILRINQRFQENREAGAPQLVIEDLWELIQYHVTTFIDNEVSGIPPARHRSGRPLKTLSQRLKGKEGRFRNNLSGKRVNFSARTVISPDPNISVNELGVPTQIAKEMTIPIEVTERNIEKMRETILRGSQTHPGANYVKRLDGRKQKITEENKEMVAEKVEVGWKVDRHLKNGDIVLFNRQPSLHRMSIMGHRVRVMPGKTFRINLCVCPPYNADFDGDEMNLHVLQGEEARAEAEVLMEVQEHLISPRFGAPIIGGIHDHITGSFMLTRKGTHLDKDDAIELLRMADIYSLPEPQTKENGEEYWTGKQIFSQVLPNDLSLKYRGELCENCNECKQIECENEAYIKIENGELKSGVIDEKAFGAFSGVILDRVVRDYGSDRALKFLNDVTRLAIRSITKFGFSIGIDDEDLPKEAEDQIERIVEKAEEEVDKLVDTYERGELEPIPGRSIEETLEMKIMQTLGNARDKTGKVAEQHLGMDNAGVVMAVSGARGSMLNLTQMTASVGQQSVRGERINRGYEKRTLSAFERDDLGATARGFVYSSYKDGLSPTEFFMHAMGGREGLVDTAVRTAQSGYMQRRLINSLQDLKISEDGTVRNTSDDIIQFEYGEDGVDPSKSFRGDPVDIEGIIDEVKMEAEK
ncbi:DNA-directed RNA polymerase subunit A' [Methanonatronarchaeum thermophilum]|uniref:DNA-directed RNA polymerase subunit Rpo1N n=1 Tax=Methanonatronarchaeum thermophilum TaxID=1927129 RepID=A0A1Y3GHM3_9EURY|nr:DNA-directed RNA polymerase subunit A' [Methanonatronarchaeum thermophilum]OUJ18935.1 DNA-directed RNA polymerase subunit A' [Methanonatronarchaeum thermophilum]